MAETQPRERWDARPLAQEPKGLCLRKDMQNIKKLERSGNTLSHGTKRGRHVKNNIRGQVNCPESFHTADAEVLEPLLYPKALRQCRG